MIKCIIVEDEALAQQVIESHLRKTEGFELAGICNNALEAKHMLDNYEVDLIFLDIQLPGMTGLSFLRSLPNPPLVVFTTAYAEHALESYEFNVVDYLLKPISFERFTKTIQKIAGARIFPQPLFQKGAFPADHIFIKSNGKFFKVNFREIIYIESIKDYLKIATAEATLITHHTLYDMEKMLPAVQFIRIHKSYIVNIAHIKAIYGNTIEMKKAALPVGSTYKEKVISLIGAAPGK